VDRRSALQNREAALMVSIIVLGSVVVLFILAYLTAIK
jgi:hypothetical protein